jgi:hypothetical protein
MQKMFRGIMYLMVLLVLQLYVSLAATPVLLTLDQETSIPARVPQEMTPVWTWGRMVRVQYNGTQVPVVSSFDEHGALVANAPFEIPGATKTRVNGFSSSPDGVLAICGWSWDDGGRLADFIAIIKPGGSTRLIRTSPYSPHKIAVVGDGSIWTMGGEATATGESRVDYDILRHYDREGNLLGSAVSRSTFKGTAWVDGGYLSASSDRIGWYTGPFNGHGSQYIEVSAASKVNRFPGLALDSHQRVTGFALSDGRPFLSTYDDGSRQSAIYSFDTGSSAWSTVQWPSLTYIGSLYGADGSRLVTTGRDQYAVRFLQQSK